MIFRAARHTDDIQKITAFYTEILDRIHKNKIREIIPENPYWRRNGIMITDPDNHCVGISPIKINE